MWVLPEGGVPHLPSDNAASVVDHGGQGVTSSSFCVLGCCSSHSVMRYTSYDSNSGPLTNVIGSSLVEISLSSAALVFC